MYKIDRRGGGGAKNRILGQTHLMLKVQNFLGNYLVTGYSISPPPS